MSYYTELDVRLVDTLNFESLADASSTYVDRNPTYFQSISSALLEARTAATAVGRITIHKRDRITGAEGVNFCTGFRISHDVLLTAAHCVPGNLARYPDIEFVKGRVVFGHYTFGQSDGEQDIVEIIEYNTQLDYALLRLEWGEGWYPWEFPSVIVRLPYVRQPRDRFAFVLHHPNALPLRMSHFGCELRFETDAAPGTLFHTCHTLGVSSGAPVMATSDGRAVALHTGGFDPNRPNDLARLNQALLLSTIWERSPVFRNILLGQDSYAFARQYSLNGRMINSGREAAGTIYFDWDRSDLNAEAQQELARVVSVIRASPNSRVLIVAQKDTEGSAAYNVGLTNRMARTVADALVASGVSGSIISMDGKGETGFLQDGVRDPFWRRADIFVLPAS